MSCKRCDTRILSHVSVSDVCAFADTCKVLEDGRAGPAQTSPKCPQSSTSPSLHFLFWCVLMHSILKLGVMDTRVIVFLDASGDLSYGSQERSMGGRPRTRWYGQQRARATKSKQAGNFHGLHLLLLFSMATRSEGFFHSLIQRLQFHVQFHKV
jgi:hypothetical protein